jgi:hypothetical protein
MSIGSIFGEECPTKVGPNTLARFDTGILQSWHWETLKKNNENITFKKVFQRNII